MKRLGAVAWVAFCLVVFPASTLVAWREAAAMIAGRPPAAVDQWEALLLWVFIAWVSSGPAIYFVVGFFEEAFKASRGRRRPAPPLPTSEGDPPA